MLAICQFGGFQSEDAGSRSPPTSDRLFRIRSESNPRKLEHNRYNSNLLKVQTAQLAHSLAPITCSITVRQLKLMGLPRFYVPDIPLNGSLALEPAEARHATQVLRLQVGSEVVLFDGRGGEAVACLMHADRKACELRIAEWTNTDRELPRGLILYVALPKGDRQKTLVEGLVQCGVSELVPLECERGVAQPSCKALQRLQRSVIEASKQCGRNMLMEIAAPVRLDELTNGPTVRTADSQRFFAHPYGSAAALAHAMPLFALPISQQPSAIGAAPSTQPDADPSRFVHGSADHVVIGPEGGLTEAEVQRLRDASWRQIGLGQRILRIEMAAISIASWHAQRCADTS